MIDPRPTVVPGEPGLLGLQSQLTNAKYFFVDCTSQPTTPPYSPLALEKALSQERKLRELPPYSIEMDGNARLDQCEIDRDGIMI